MNSLSDTLAALERLAPLGLAEDWDNVGVLVEPPNARVHQAGVSKLALTIDLDDRTLDEALAAEADMLVAYHPPIFGGLKRLRASVPQERVVLRAAAAGLVVYSPHTALDAVPGGVNDWLVGLCGGVDARPIVPHRTLPTAGAGRSFTLATPAPLSTLVTKLKAALALPTVRVATAAAHESDTAIRTIAVCPGAGGSLLARAPAVDLWLTGELRHHDVRALLAADCSVILTEHTNCERGYLPLLARALEAALPGVSAFQLTSDRDPLVVR